MINSNELKNAIGTLYKVVPPRTTMPILQNILFESKNGRLELTANDLVKSLTLYINAKKDYSCCVPAKTINELLSVIGNNEIDITQKEDKVIINRNPGRTTIKTKDINEFPIPEIDIHNVFDIDSQILSNALKKCIISVSDDKSHEILSGVLIKSNDNILTVASADGFRMTYITLMFGLPDFEVIMPKESAQILISVLEAGAVKMAVNNSKIAFITDYFKFTSQLIAGNFPQMERIIPQSWETEIEIDKTQLSKAVKTALIFAKDIANTIAIQIENDQIIIRGMSNEIGNDSTPIKDFKITGKPVDEIGVNGRYLLDGLTLTEKRVIIKFNGPKNPIGLFLSDDSHFVHLVMPMAIKK